MKTRNYLSSLASFLFLATLSPQSSTLFGQSSWNLDGNLVAPGQFLGSTNYQPVELWAAGYRILRLEPDPGGSFAGNLIGGYTNNVIEQPGSGGNVISGGGYGGGPNIIRPNSRGNFIGAGSGNQVGPNINDAVIGGGYGNTVEAFNSIIGSGLNNTIQGGYSVIGGGDDNIIQFAADHSAIVCGSLNTIVGSETLPVYGFIGGGYFNTLQTNAVFSTIAGGIANSINAGASNSTISGGFGNVSGGQSATVPGGFGNTAFGNCSFAAGSLAAAYHDGTFVWAGGAKTVYPSVRPNMFNAYASSGASFDYGGQLRDGRGKRWFYVGDVYAGSTVSVWNGARLTDGGVWANACDKHRKTDFKEVDSREILQRLAALPVREWRYTNETAGAKHLGPTAQDFQAAFGLGDDDKSIGTVDADGVALVAIQGLNQKLEEKSQEVRQLKERLEKLERLVEESRADGR